MDRFQRAWTHLVTALAGFILVVTVAISLVGAGVHVDVTRVITASIGVLFAVITGAERGALDASCPVRQIGAVMKPFATLLATLALAAVSASCSKPGDAKSEATPSGKDAPALEGRRIDITAGPEGYSPS